MCPHLAEPITAADTMDQLLFIAKDLRSNFVMARLPLDHATSTSHHAEALVVQALRVMLQNLHASNQPILIYSVICPCEMCAASICKLADDFNVEITVVFERGWSPLEHDWGPSDTTVISRMESSGVMVATLGSMPGLT